MLGDDLAHDLAVDVALGELLILAREGVAERTVVDLARHPDLFDLLRALHLAHLEEFARKVDSLHLWKPGAEFEECRERQGHPGTDSEFPSHLPAMDAQVAEELSEDIHREWLTVGHDIFNPGRLDDLAGAEVDCGDRGLTARIHVAHLVVARRVTAHVPIICRSGPVAGKHDCLEAALGHQLEKPGLTAVVLSIGELVEMGLHHLPFTNLSRCLK